MTRAPGRRTGDAAAPPRRRRRLRHPGRGARVGRRAEFLDAQLERLDELIVPLVTTHAPALLALYGIGPDTAALLLVAAGDHPERLRSEAARAHLCAVARSPPPQEGSPGIGSTPAGPAGQPPAVADRDHPDELPSADPHLCRTAHRRGLAGEEIIRCLKRYVAREIYPHLRAAAG